MKQIYVCSMFTCLLNLDAVVDKNWALGPCNKNVCYFKKNEVQSQNHFSTCQEYTFLTALCICFARTKGVLCSRKQKCFRSFLNGYRGEVSHKLKDECLESNDNHECNLARFGGIKATDLCKKRKKKVKSISPLNIY